VPNGRRRFGIPRFSVAAARARIHSHFSAVAPNHPPARALRKQALVMLRILIETSSHETTLRLDGRLAGPWVDELERSWAMVRTTSDAGSLRVDLEGVTFIAPAGKALLRRIHDEGAVLIAHGCMTRAIVDDINDGVETKAVSRS
jgi:hypothetical protein